MSSINKDNIQKSRSKVENLSVEDLFKRLSQGDISALGKAITLIESSDEKKILKGRKVLELCSEVNSTAIRIGITGVPGVGKSTFIESFGLHLIEKFNKKVAVLAIDPTSKKSGGSILGDKTRMEELSRNTNAFIRPSATGNSLGGVANNTKESIALCEAAGFDIVIVETVGVGQSETEVRDIVDFFLLLMLAGAGDELQGIKRGIMEMADALVINKADGENIKKAKMARIEYKSALHLFPPTESGWIPEVLTCSALEKSGIKEVWEMIEKYVHQAKSSNFWTQNRLDQDELWLEQSLNREIIRKMEGQNNYSKQLLEAKELLRTGSVKVFELLNRLSERV